MCLSVKKATMKWCDDNQYEIKTRWLKTNTLFKSVSSFTFNVFFNG